jgi:hypothetical protein
MTGKPKEYEDDDGRVICSMDVEGMPWHDRRAFRLRKPTPPPSQGETMTHSETQGYVWYSILAALTIVGVFAAGWVVLILFLLNIWAR